MQLSGDDKRAMGLPAAQELTAEQQAELEKFQKERAAIRIKLREVRHQLNHDIEALGSKLKFINILAVPMVLAFGMLVMAGLRYLRRRDRTQH